MTLEQLRIFVAVAEREHITRAAQALNMTQSAVSAAVTALETRHNVLLFDRVGRSIVLNQVGRAFLKEAVAVLARAQEAEAALSDLAGLARGTLSIMASQTIAGYWLPARLAGFHRRFPGITLDIRIGNTEQVADAVETGTVELGLVEGLVERGKLSSSIIATDEMVIVVAPDHPWAKATTISPADFPSTAWVLREQGSGTRAAFERLIASTGLATAALDIVMILPDNEIVMGTVEAGIGATLISRSVASSRLHGGLLVEASFPATLRPFYTVRHTERYLSKASEVFTTLIGEANETVAK